jgi:hypothetical protein
LYSLHTKGVSSYCQVTKSVGTEPHNLSSRGYSGCVAKPRQILRILGTPPHHYLVCPHSRAMALGLLLGQWTPLPYGCLQPLPLPLSPPQWPSFSNVLPRSQCCVLALLVDLLKPRKGPHEGEAGGALRILQVSSPKQTCGRAESDLGDWNPPFHPGLCPPCDPGQFLPLSFLIPSCPRRG